jgi:signal transduction histidine kinase/ActR/RegA family two-component response regulator
MRRLLSRSSRILLILALLALAYNGVLISLATLFSTDGCSVYLDQAGLVLNRVPADSPLQLGDVVVAVNGRGVSQELARPGAWHRFLFGPAAREATYTVERTGERLQVQVPWETHTLFQALGDIGLLLLIGSLFIVSGVLLLLSRTRDPAAPIIALFFIVEGFNLINNAWSAVGTGLVLSTYWFFFPLDLLSFALTFAAALHGFLTFPEPKAQPRRLFAVYSLTYAINLLVAGAGILGYVLGDGLAVRALVYRVFYPLAGLELLAGIGLITHTYLTTRRPGVRNQIRWIVWGVILGPLPWLLFYNLPVALGSTPLVPLPVASLALAIIPVAFFLSVTRRWLSLVDTVINRTIIYTVLVTVLVGGYMLVVAGLNALTRAILGVADTRLSAIVGIILVVLTANRLRTALYRLTQRLFYRHWVDMQQLLREVGEQLARTLQLETIVPLLTQEIPQRLQLTRAALLLRQENGAFRSADGSIAGFPNDHPLVAQAEGTDVPLVVGHARLRTGVLAELEVSGWEVALPLRSGGRLVGLYFLGARRSGDLYTRQEVESLRALGRQVAATLENARLYSQVESYTEQLEDLVAARTQELARANQALASERDRLDVVLQNMADGLLVTNPAGEILLLNPVLETIVHRPAGYLVGQPAGEVLCLPALAELLDEAAGRPDQVLTTDLVWEDKVLRASATALHDQSAVITVLRDITQEKEVDRMKTEFVSTVSHELRAPLTSVLGFAKLIGKTLERDVLPWVPAEDGRGQRAVTRVRENLEIIVSEGERLTRLINDVLDIARMEAGRIEWRDQSFELGPVIQQAVGNVRAMATAKGLPIDLEIEATLPTLFADPDRVLQVSTNLLSNALKFTDQGRVTVMVRSLGPGAEVHGWSVPAGDSGAVLVAVRDTGVGIPEEAIGRLFQRFQQVESTLTNRPKGTGLGLAICREIVAHYGGAIWADSQVDQGSCFCFTLPVMPAVPREGARPAAQIVAATPLRFRPATVLVVDDETHIRTLLHQTLADAGYKVLEASDGTIAVTEARQHRPDLVILDVNMPGLSGFDVARLLRTEKSTARIPIVILSVEDPRQSADIGAAAHLTKPVEIESLLRTVARLLGREMFPATGDATQGPQQPPAHHEGPGRVLR